jgi:uncharacterized protein (TIGR03790 family)
LPAKPTEEIVMPQLKDFPMLQMLRLLALAAAIFCLISDRKVTAGGGAQNVAVIANPDDADSLAIANYYVELRDIPPVNVVYIPWRTDLHSTTAFQFRERLLQPFLATLQQRDLVEQIDFVAFSSGYPYLIDCAPLFREQQFPPQARPLASLTSAMFFYKHILDENLAMFSPAPHEYFAPTVNGNTTSAAFSSRQRGANQGEVPTKTHLLATALGVTHGHGNSGGEITACLRRAKAADGTKPRGTIYYMQNKDVRSRVRDAEFAAAVRELRAAGVEAMVLQGVEPAGKSDVAGLTTGSSHVNLKGSGSALLAGALVDNLTSAGGQMLLRNENNPQTRISEYIRLGAAGATGAVIEPFAIAQKFPTAALHVHYARGCSLAESFYQSIAAPFQLLIIGDPLCQPWAVGPAVQVDGLNVDSPISGDAVFTPSAKYGDIRKARQFELYIDGVSTQVAKPGEAITVSTTQLSDGWHDLRVVAVDDTPIEVQGDWMTEIVVANGDGRLEINQTGPLRAESDSVIAVDVVSTVSADAHIVHNGRRIASVSGGSGSVKIDAKKLGKGRTRIHAEQDGADPLRSRSVFIEID